mmetsp:Transcript_62233/g.143289  ORF Transcript_62233/g.143289 Transcript_62233/m.143289 type:complete len:204 (+) Transcript_62233:397-1008(+)
MPTSPCRVTCHLKIHLQVLGQGSLEHFCGLHLQPCQHSGLCDALRRGYHSGHDTLIHFKIIIPPLNQLHARNSRRSLSAQPFLQLVLALRRRPCRSRSVDGILESPQHSLVPQRGLKFEILSSGSIQYVLQSGGKQGHGSVVHRYEKKPHSLRLPAAQTQPRIAPPPTPARHTASAHTGPERTPTSPSPYSVATPCLAAAENS